MTWGTQVMRFVSRTTTVGERGTSSEGANICQELEETHTEKPESVVVLRHIAWVSSQPSPPALYCYVTLGR